MFCVIFYIDLSSILYILSSILSSPTSLLGKVEIFVTNDQLISIISIVSYRIYLFQPGGLEIALGFAQ